MMMTHVYVVEPGNTLSEIARQFDTTYQVLAADNHIPDPNLIYVGQDVTIPGAYSQSEAPAPSQQYQAPSSSPSPSDVPYVATGGLSDVPGVPSSFAACVAYRESSDLANPAADGNAYGIIPASGYNVAGDSLAQQKQVFAELYHQYGTQPWAPSDHC